MKHATNHRRAMTVVETIVAAAMLTGMLAVCLQMLGAVAARHRTTETRQLAIREAANLMERISAIPWDELSPETVDRVELSESASRRLTGAELTVDVAESTDPIEQRRITLSIRWKDRSGEFVRPVKLTAWRARR